MMVGLRRRRSQSVQHRGWAWPVLEDCCRVVDEFRVSQICLERLTGRVSRVATHATERLSAAVATAAAASDDDDDRTANGRPTQQLFSC